MPLLIKRQISAQRFNLKKMLKPLLQKLQNKRIILASGSKNRATLLSSTVSDQQMSPHITNLKTILEFKF